MLWYSYQNLLCPACHCLPNTVQIMLLTLPHDRYVPIRTPILPNTIYINSSTLPHVRYVPVRALHKGLSPVSELIRAISDWQCTHSKTRHPPDSSHGTLSYGRLAQTFIDTLPCYTRLDNTMRKCCMTELKD